MQSRLAPQKRNPWIITKIKVTYVRFSVLSFHFSQCFRRSPKIAYVVLDKYVRNRMRGKKGKATCYDEATAANAHYFRNIMFASDRTSCARVFFRCDGQIQKSSQPTTSKPFFQIYTIETRNSSLP